MKVSEKDFNTALVDFYSAKKTQRFGQFLANRFDVTDNKLFYKDDPEAGIYFVEKYLETNTDVGTETR